jgi:hypothetical protein
VALGLIVGFLFLEETHQDKQGRTDVGLVLGRRLLRAVPCIGHQSCEETSVEEARRIANDEKGDYQPIPTSPQMKASSGTSTEDPTASITEKSNVSGTVAEPKVSFYKSLTKQIKLIILSYGLLAL